MFLVCSMQYLWSCLRIDWLRAPLYLTSVLAVAILQPACPSWSVTLRCHSVTVLQMKSLSADKGKAVRIILVIILIISWPNFAYLFVDHIKELSTNCVRSFTSAFMVWPHRTLWRRANQFSMSLVLAAYVSQLRRSGCPVNQNVNLYGPRSFAVSAPTYYLNRSVTQPRHSDSSNSD